MGNTTSRTGCIVSDLSILNPLWLTFRQATEFGAHVRKGEKATLVVYADRFTSTEENEAGEKTERTIPFLKTYHVFNAQQIENLPAMLVAQCDKLGAKLLERDGRHLAKCRPENSKGGAGRITGFHKLIIGGVRPTPGLA